MTQQQERTIDGHDKQEAMKAELKSKLVAYRATLERLTDEELEKIVKDQLQVDISGGAGKWPRERLMEALCRQESAAIFYSKRMRPPDSLTRGTLIFLAESGPKPVKKLLPVVGAFGRRRDGETKAARPQQSQTAREDEKKSTPVTSRAAPIEKKLEAPRNATRVLDDASFLEPPVSWTWSTFQMTTQDEDKLKPRNVETVKKIDVDSLLKRCLRGKKTFSFVPAFPDKKLWYCNAKRGSETYLGPIVDHRFYARPTPDGSVPEELRGDPNQAKIWRVALAGGQKGFSFWELAALVTLTYAGSGMTLSRMYDQLWWMAKKCSEFAESADPPIVMAWPKD